eukprot:10718842-Alexandrium_andersonii.AAC.1
MASGEGANNDGGDDDDDDDDDDYEGSYGECGDAEVRMMAVILVLALADMSVVKMLLMIACWWR